MPQVIDSTQKLPDSLGLTKTETMTLIPILEALKRGDLGEAKITDAGGQTLKIRLDGNNNQLSYTLNKTIADNTLAQNIIIHVAHHTFARFLTALRHWGDGYTEFIFNIPGSQGGNWTLRFFYTGA